MDQAYYFHSAKWVGPSERKLDGFSLLRGHFSVDNVTKATLNVLGLGFFKCYINGHCVNPDTFLPLSSEYEASNFPAGEVFSGKRVYVPQFDITPFLRPGDNVIAIHYGGGWYTYHRRPFGLPKAIYCICAETKDGVLYHVSDENCRVNGGFVESYSFTEQETQNLSAWPAGLAPEFDDSGWPFATPTKPLDTEYCTTPCPADTLIATLPVCKLGPGARGMVYDCGQNTTGYPLLEAEAGQTICVYFSEALLEDGTLDPVRAHNQSFTVTTGQTPLLIQPEFTWFGFRYIEVVGKATPKCVKVIHADVPVTSSFSCDNECLNWIYNTFLHTMACNLHNGHPSDCPHIERRGYTGDGQLTCHAVLSTMGARSFYEKWLQDIADGQDTLTGHIQYTAPYIRSGGGPGGWGCAIVEVPYQLYKHYGDGQILDKYYANMCSYLEFLEAHTEFGLVTSDKEGEWCLGDWCGPVILYPELGLISNRQQFLIPPPLVNTYFAVKSLTRLEEIAGILGKTEDIPAFRQKAEQYKKAFHAAYFTPYTHDYISNAQGANAFALKLGLGTERTMENLLNYYRKLGHYDTGIFATDILTELLFETGNGELALDLLTGVGAQGFAVWQQSGATTFREYWDSGLSRSHNHPMFGSVVAYLFSHLLGIGQAGAGYESLVIEPRALARFGRLSGSMITPKGTVSVHYQKENGKQAFRITIPEETNAIFRFGGREYPLSAGLNTFTDL